MLTFIFAHALIADQISNPAYLGRQRSEFGETQMRLTRTDEDYMRELPWFCNNMSYHDTIMLFPAGTADRRFYINNAQTIAPTLALLTKTNGKVNREWLIHLKPDAKAIQSGNRYDGTLGKFLVDCGWIVTSTVTPAIRKTLSTIKGFAYYKTTGGGIGLMVCGYVQLDGKLVLEPGLDVELPLDSPKGYGFPKTPFDYPVTQAERRELAKPRSRTSMNADHIERPTRARPKLGIQATSP